MVWSRLTRRFKSRARNHRNRPASPSRQMSSESPSPSHRVREPSLSHHCMAFAGHRCGNAVGMWESDGASLRVSTESGSLRAWTWRSVAVRSRVSVTAMLSPWYSARWRILDPQAHDATQTPSLPRSGQADQSRLTRPLFCRLDMATDSNSSDFVTSATSGTTRRPVALAISSASFVA